jgi:hypothetical protein
VSGVVSPAQWLAVAAFLVLASLATTQLGAIWRGEQTRRWPEWLARSLPACIVAGWLMLAALAIELFVISRPEPVSPWLVLRWAVPPYLRRGHERR